MKKFEKPKSDAKQESDAIVKTKRNTFVVFETRRAQRQLVDARRNTQEEQGENTVSNKSRNS